MRNQYIIAGCLVIVVFAVFAQVLRHDFLNYDDDVYVTSNQRVTSGLSVDGILWAFTTSSASNWHPLTWLSHQLDCSIYGPRPGGHHATSLILHLANVLLLFWLLTRITGNSGASGFVAALFGIHPQHIQSVAWLAERKDVLSAFFWMLTMLSYCFYTSVWKQNGKAARPKSSKWKPQGVKPSYAYALTIIIYCLGLMSKPMLVSLPFVLLLIDYWPLGRFGENGPGTVRLLFEKFPFLALAVASGVITFVVQRKGGTVSPLEEIQLSVRAANAVVTVLIYLTKTIWPSNLAVFYPHPQTTIPLWQVVASAAFVAGVSIAAIRFAKQLPYLLVGWFWYLVTLTPVIGIMQVGSQARADRYTYIPLIGIFIIIAWGVPDLVRRFIRKPQLTQQVLMVAAVVVVLAFTTAAYVQTGYWRNSISLLTHALKVTDRNVIAHNNLGVALGETREYNLADKHFREAARWAPKYDLPHFNMGIFAVRRNDMKRALVEYQTAIKINPNYAKSHTNLGGVLLGFKRVDEAEAQFKEAIRLDPDDVLAHSNLAAIYSARGRIDKAIPLYKQAVQIEPENAYNQFKLAVLFAQEGKYDEAVSHYKAALRAHPEYVEARNNLALALFAKGQSEEAVRQLREALRISPGWLEASNNLAWTLATSKNSTESDTLEAVKLAEDVCKRDKQKRPGMLDTLAVAYAAAGRYSDAIQTAQKSIALARAAGNVKLANSVTQRLALYKSGKPYKENL